MRSIPWHEKNATEWQNMWQIQPWTTIATGFSWLTQHRHWSMQDRSPSHLHGVGGDHTTETQCLAQHRKCTALLLRPPTTTPSNLLVFGSNRHTANLCFTSPHYNMYMEHHQPSACDGQPTHTPRQSQQKSATAGLPTTKLATKIALKQTRIAPLDQQRTSKTATSPPKDASKILLLNHSR